MSAETLDAWLARIAGGPVRARRQLVAGNSRTTYAVDVDDHPLVVRVDAGDGPFSDTPLALRREASVYQALQATDVPVAGLYGYSPDLDALALQRLPGEPAWDDDVLDALLRALGELHALDVTTLELPGLARTARGELELWADMATRRIAPPSPFVDLAIALLRDTFPGEPDRVALIHGDPGPGNLLWHEGRITGLLDWEMSHLGDPHDDLAFLTVRAVLHGLELPDFARRVRDHYAPRVGVALDDRRLRYWQAVSILRNLVICSMSIANPVRGRDRLVHFMLVPSLQRMLVDALADLTDTRLAPAPTAPAPTPALPAPPAGAAVAEIAADLKELGAALDDPDALQRVKRMRHLLAQVADAWPALGGLAARAADDPRPSVDSEPQDQLRWLSRAADRDLAVFPRARALAALPLARL